MRYPLDALSGFALLFSLLTSTPTLSNANPSGYEFVGCYVDSNNRVLSVWADGVEGRVSTMTNELCASQCVGYLYFGTEDSNQCLCGNELIPGAALAPTTTCNEACEGNDNEFCGGFWLISIYKLSVASTTSSSSSTPTPSSAGNGSGNGNGNGNGNVQGVNIGKSSADGLSGPSKIAIGVTVPAAVLALAGFLWHMARRQRRRLTRQDQTRDVTDEPENKRIGYEREQWEMKPELGVNDAKWPKLQQNRVRYTAAHEVAEAVGVPNNLIQDTRRNVVEMPGNPTYELHNPQT